MKVLLYFLKMWCLYFHIEWVTMNFLVETPDGTVELRSTSPKVACLPSPPTSCLLHSNVHLLFHTSFYLWQDLIYELTVESSIWSLGYEGPTQQANIWAQQVIIIGPYTGYLFRSISIMQQNPASKTQALLTTSPLPFSFNWCCLWMGWQSCSWLALSHTSHSVDTVHFPHNALSISGLPFIVVWGGEGTNK